MKIRAFLGSFNLLKILVILMKKLYNKPMENEYQRTSLLIGEEGIKKLQNAKVIVYGLGGVGSFAVEALARAGIGHLVLVDNDVVDITNTNRQIIATSKTIGKDKVDVMRERILEINPKIIVETHKPEIGSNEEEFFDDTFDYVVDAIDTLSTELRIIKRAKELNVKIITCTGAAKKLDPTKFEVADIYSTSVCPVAKLLRKELKKLNIDSLKVVYSKEEPIKIEGNKLGSISFVPSVAGLIMAGEVIKDIIKE